MTRIILPALVLALLVLSISAPVSAQTEPAKPIQSGNDPNYAQGKGGINSYPSPSAIKYMPERDLLDRRIDLYMGDWRESMPRSLHGSLIVRDLLTKGDNFTPPQKSAILRYTNFVAYATLPPHGSTPPVRLISEQEVFYCTGGTGTLSAGGATGRLHKDVAALMPPNLEFVMRNTGDQVLTMYIISEPVGRDFKANDKLLMIDEREAHVRTPAGPDPYIVPGASGHWGHVVRELFAKRDGLASLGAILTVELQPMSLGEPHPHGPFQEEVWTQLEGTSIAWEGTGLRMQRPGMAYMIRPDGLSTHTNVNFGDTTIKFLYSVAGPPK